MKQAGGWTAKKAAPRERSALRTLVAFICNDKPSIKLIKKAVERVGG